MAKKVTLRNMETGLAELVVMAKKDKEDGRAISDALNQMLDDLLDQDFFGTEGQLDPRGDHRDE